MPRISLSLKFIKEIIQLFREKSLKELIFGKKVFFSAREAGLTEWIKRHIGAIAFGEDFIQFAGRPF